MLGITSPLTLKHALFLTHLTVNPRYREKATDKSVAFFRVLEGTNGAKKVLNLSEVTCNMRR